MVECNDKRCPIHGSLSVRGSTFAGIVVSAKPGKTALVERTIVRHVPKYERYKKSKSRVYAHNPSCIDAKENDIVRVAETRKLSKTKSFVVLRVIGKKKIVKAEEDTFKEREKKEEETEKKEEESKPENKEEKKERKEEPESKEKEESQAEEKKESGEKA
jgi:small subunit ribosomal protein S17